MPPESHIAPATIAHAPESEEEDEAATARMHSNYWAKALCRVSSWFGGVTFNFFNLNY